MGERERWRAWIVPLIAAAAGIALSFGVRKILLRMEDTVIEAQFQSDADDVENSIDRELDSAGEALLALRAFFAGSDEVTEDEFHKFALWLRAGHREVELLLWAEKVDGQSYPVRFAEPFNKDEIGIDLAEDAGRREAIQLAGTDGQTSASPPYGPRMLLFAQANSGKQRGLIAARIDICKVAERALNRLGAQALGLTLVDVQGAEPTVLFQSGEAAGRVARRTLRFGQRNLQLRVGHGDAYAETRRTAAPMAVLIAMLVATALGLGYVRMLQSRTARVEKLVEDRTATIREVTRLQHAILESAEYAIIAFDPEGRIIKFNPAAERMLRYGEEEVVGRMRALDFLDPDHVRETARHLDVEPDMSLILRQAGRGVVGPWIFRRSDGSTFPGSISISALHDEAERITGFLAIARDISARLEAEKQLREAKSQAETASQTKSQFLANMSHELRTPLTAILGYSEMLEEDARGLDNEESIADLQKIQQAGRHLLRLIDDVLDLSKVEAGRLVLHPESVEVSRIVEDVVSTVRPLAEERGNTLSCRCEEATLEADPTRLKQVLFNLVANAARFTKNGRIVLEAIRDGDAVTFSVRDTGIGMTEEQLGRVFEPFVQADNTTTRRFGGTGLGLAIAREFTELMGGSLEAESVPGSGSEFRVRVPVKPS